MKKLASVVMAGSLLFFGLPAVADDDECPGSVRAAVEKAYPGSVVKDCDLEEEDGRPVYEVTLKTRDGLRIKMDLDASGGLVLTEHYLPDDGAPAVVVKSFKTKYPNIRVVRTEKWAWPDGRVSYRFVYAKDGGKWAVVYSNEGAFVSEVQLKVDDDDWD